MPNWVEQELHVVGSKADVDAFVRTGYLTRKEGQFDDVLDLHRLCPLRSREPKSTYTHESAVVLVYHRTKTQAHFSLITSWDYPAEFYARLAKHWPTLAFACTVNEEMGGFGGFLMVLNGEVTNLVEDYGEEGYSRRKQSRRIRKAMNVWGEFLMAGRDWRLAADEPWRRRSIPVDAHFDDDFWFFFGSREEMAAFKKKFGGRFPLRRAGGKWIRTRV